MDEPLQSFGDNQLSKQVLQALSEMGFEEPSPIQKEAIPVALEGLDLIGQAQTGTGKTAAFGIPITEKVNPKFLAVQALIVTPTRELAIQVAEEIAKIGKYRHVKLLPIYGGQPIDRQIRALRMGYQVVVGTPGRLLDHLNRGTLRLHHVKMVVLDEADELVVALEARGYFADALHGDLDQQHRDRVMKRFRDGKSELLVATDVAARGLDINNVTHVINFDIPQDPVSYVHRIGRTGRVGRKGKAITLISPKEYRQLRLIENLIKTRIRRQELPPLADISEHQAENLKKQIMKLIQSNHLEIYRTIVSELLENYDATDVAAAALKFAVEGASVQERIEDKDQEELQFVHTGAAAGMVRFFMNIGRVQQICAQDIIHWIADESGIPGNIIGMINIYDNFTFAEVPAEYASIVLSCMNHAMIKGRRVNVEPAKARGNADY